MASNIKMNYEELFTTAKGFNNQASEVSAVLRNAENLIETLKGSWEGDASIAFEGQFISLKPSVQKMIELFDDIAMQLNNIAKTTAEYDREIARKISRN